MYNLSACGPTTDLSIIFSIGLSLMTSKFGTSFDSNPPKYLSINSIILSDSKSPEIQIAILFGT